MFFMCIVCLLFKQKIRTWCTTRVTCLAQLLAVVFTFSICIERKSFQNTLLYIKFCCAKNTLQRLCYVQFSWISLDSYWLSFIHLSVSIERNIQTTAFILALDVLERHFIICTTNSVLHYYYTVVICI